MRLFSTLFFSLLITLFLANHATAQRGRDVGSFDKADSTQGLVIYSISTTKPTFNHYYLDIFHLESRKKEKLEFGTFQLADVKNDSAKVYYFAVKLPIGDYKIYGWGMVTSYGYGGTTIQPRGNFGLPFTVFGGSISYLGDYLGSAGKGSFIGLEVPKGGYFIVSNRYEEDYKAISEKWPSLDLTGVLNAMPDFSENKPTRSLMFLKGINIP